MKPQITLSKEKILLTKSEIYSAILENIKMIESTLLFWMAVQFGKDRSILKKVESIKSFAQRPLSDQITRTQGLVPLEYLNDRNLESLLQCYKRVIDLDKVENPGRYGKTRKLKQIT